MRQWDRSVGDGGQVDVVDAVPEAQRLAHVPRSPAKLVDRHESLFAYDLFVEKSPWLWNIKLCEGWFPALVQVHPPAIEVAVLYVLNDGGWGLEQGPRLGRAGGSRHTRS